MSTQSPNMQLPIPTVGSDSGPTYAELINSCLTLIDQHTHTSGSGVQITSDAINVTANLSFSGFSAVDLAGLTLTEQLSSPANVTIYSDGEDLFYTDGSGNDIQITDNGGIAGTPGSISNLTSPASASYVALSQTFVWQSNTNIAANMDGGSVIMRNLSPNSTYGLTLSPPAALSANYTLTLPALPASTRILSVTTGGVIAAGVANAVVGDDILAGAVTESKIAAGAVSETRIGTSAVTTAKIADSNVTTAKIADSNVTTAKIADSNVTTAKIADSNVTTAKINNLAVTAAKIADATITAGKIVSATLTGTQMASNNDYPGNSTQIGSRYNVTVNTNATLNAGFGIIKGSVSAGATVVNGEGFTVASGGTGIYNITFTTSYVDVPSVAIDSNDAAAFRLFIVQPGTGGVTIRVGAINFGTSSIDLTNSSFNFIVIGQKST